MDGIEIKPEGTTVCTGKGIDAFALLALRGMVRLECAGMMRRGQSASSVAKARFGFKGNKHKVLEQLNALCAEVVAHRAEPPRMRPE